MTNPRIQHFISFTAALLLSQIILLPITDAAGRLLESADIRRSFGVPELIIRFTEPVQYINHAPETAGDELQIQLRPVGPQPPTLSPPVDETLAWKASPGMPVADISYEGNEAGGRLRIRFSHTVSFAIRPGADLRTLIVAVKAPGSGAIQKPPLQIEPLDPAAAEYAINLESSLTPIDLDRIPEHEVFRTYHLYTTRFKLDGKVWYRLRIGYFATETEAEAVMRSVKALFPQAWVTKVSLKARERAARAPIIRQSPIPQSAEKRAPIVRSLETDKQAETVVELGPTEIRPIDPNQIDPAVKFAAEDSELLRPEEVKALLETLRKAASSGDELAMVPECDEKLLALMEQARQAMAKEDHARAIALYTKVLRTPNTPCARDAQEFLALARERQGQLAHAKAEYDKYLEAYPEGEGSERVKQRIAALTTSRQTPKQKRRAARGDEPYWDVYGGVSQFYRRNETTFDLSEQEQQNLVTLSGLFSDIDITARRRSQNYDIRARVTGGHIKDFLEDGPGDRTQVTSAYVDATDLRRDLSARIGRQTLSTGGALGRFDGALFGYRFGPRIKLNAVAGYPVSFSDNSINSDRQFYGVHTELGTYREAWDFIPFFMEQHVSGILDRRAVGLETRYFQPNRTFLSLIDYDVSYGKLNNFLLLGNWTLPNRMTFNFNVDYRNAPVLTTNNALIGQTAASIDELLMMLPEEQIRELALDHTPTSKSITVGLSRPISEKLQLSGDVTVMELSDFVVTDVEMLDPLNPPSPFDDDFGIIPGTGKQYFYNLQLIGSSLFKQGDIGILGLRYSDTSTSSTSTITLNTRYPVNRAWRINPRLRVDYRKNKMDDGSQFVTLPSIRVDFRTRKNLRLELETGWEILTRKLVDGLEEDRTGYFINLGYRWNY